MTDDRRKAHLARLKTMFDQAPIARAFGMTLSYDGEHRAVFTQPYNASFDHSIGGIHGGVFATMLDNAGWFTVAVHYETWIATVEFQVRLLEPVQKEELVATGRLVHSGKRIATAEMEVCAGGRRVAIGSGTFTVTSQPLPEI